MPSTMPSALAAITCALALLAGTQAFAFNPNNPAASRYKVSLFDDFKSFNAGLWESDWWYATPDACQSAYLPGTALTSPSGLDLHIESLENFAACAGGSQIYSAAHLDSYGHFGQKLGYYEARIKSSASGGTLTAFWLLPQSGAWPPELDIEEIRGDVPATAYMTNHTGAQNRQTQYVFTAPASLGAAYHTYGALITATKITWYIDGIERGQTARGPGELAQLFPVFSLYTGTCGDGWAGCPVQSTGWSAEAHVKWVRVWAAP